MDREQAESIRDIHGGERFCSPGQATIQVRKKILAAVDIELQIAVKLPSGARTPPSQSMPKF